MIELRRTLCLLVASVSIVSLGVAGCTQKTATNVQTSQIESEVQTPESKLDVPYLPTPKEVVAEMLELADVKGDDVLYDLGCGDGRVVIAAAQKFGTRGVGVDIDPQRIKEANENAQKAGVRDRVKFLQQDLFQTDLSEATVVMLYLLPDINLKLRPKLLQELKPGTRIVSHDFDMGEWKPQRVVQVQGPQRENTLYYEDGKTMIVRGPQREHTLYYWVVPENVPDSLQ